MLSFYLEGKDVVIKPKEGFYTYTIDSTDQITSINVDGCSEPVLFIVPKELIIRHNSPKETWSDDRIKGLSLVVELRDEARKAKSREIYELKAQLAAAIIELGALED